MVPVLISIFCQSNRPMIDSISYKSAETVVVGLDTELQ